MLLRHLASATIDILRDVQGIREFGIGITADNKTFYGLSVHAKIFFDPPCQTETYRKYADAHVRELITRYKPAVLWNDIDYPKSGHPLEIMAEYYQAVPDGVVDDRFGVKHSDFISPEYQTLEKINPKKWEECRGLGRSFGYNRAEGETETIKPAELIYLLVDIVSKNGSLLLDVGPEADGTIPDVQMDRLKALGAWLPGERRSHLRHPSLEAR
jgi:alpha-L-fucosidase